MSECELNYLRTAINHELFTLKMRAIFCDDEEQLNKLIALLKELNCSTL